jgi:phosphoribosylformylglycinamidine cyclo-ligase
MNTDDLLCVGAISDFVVTSTLGRNKRLIPGEVIKALIQGTEEFCDQMRQWNVPVYFAGGETADVGDLVKTVMVDSNISCRVPASQLITASNIKPGNIVLGLASYGQTSYESSWNSGIASNGITLARHILLHPNYALEYPESIDSWFLETGGYSGRFRLSDTVLVKNPTLGEGLLSPTRTFAPIFQEIFRTIPKGKITGIIHNTGGAHSKVKNFIDNVLVEKKINWEVPEIFRLIQKEAGIGDPELFRTFNCGIRMEIYCQPEVAEEILNISRGFGLDAFEIGMVKQSSVPSVKIRSGDQEWSY